MDMVEFKSSTMDKLSAKVHRNNVEVVQHRYILYLYVVVLYFTAVHVTTFLYSLYLEDLLLSVVICFWGFSVITSYLLELIQLIKIEFFLITIVYFCSELEMINPYIRKLEVE
jgi:hypothetical protein